MSAHEAPRRPTAHGGSLADIIVGGATRAINAYAASHCISAVIASSFASFCIVFTVETRVVF